MSSRSKPEDPRRILFLGQFPRSSQRSLQVSEELAEHLTATAPWSAELCSTRSTRVARLVEQIFAAATTRHDVCVVNLFGGRSFWSAAAAMTILQHRRRKSVVHLHGGSLPRFAHRHPRSLRRTLQAASAVVAPSPYLARSLSDFHSTIEVIPNGVDLDCHSEHVRPRPRSGSQTILWLRSFHPIYDPQLAIRVFAQVARVDPEVRLRMIGTVLDPGELRATQQLISDLGVEPRVELSAGIPKSAVSEVMRDADVFFNTTTVDNAPVTLVEAMASGLPIVSTDVGGIPDLLQHRSSGLLAPAGDVNRLSEALLSVLADRELANRLGENGRERARHHAWPGILHRWTELFEALMQKSPAHAAASTGFVA